MIPVDEKEQMNDLVATSNFISKMQEKILKNWFILGVVTVIFFARLNPDIGLKGGERVCSYCFLRRLRLWLKSCRLFDAEHKDHKLLTTLVVC